jgi:hypothetical protein
MARAFAKRTVVAPIAASVSPTPQVSCEGRDLGNTPHGDSGAAMRVVYHAWLQLQPHLVSVIRLLGGTRSLCGARITVPRAAMSVGELIRSAEDE